MSVPGMSLKRILGWCRRVCLHALVTEIPVFGLLSACTEERVRIFATSNQPAFNKVLTVILVPGTIYAFLGIPRNWRVSI